MKYIIIILFIGLNIININAQTNLDADILKCVNKLKKKPTHKKYAPLLIEKFKNANEKDLKRLKELSKENVLDKEKIFKSYFAIDQRQKIVGEIIQLQSESYKQNFFFEKLDTKLLIAREEAADYLYNKASELLKTKDILECKKAYYEFKKIDQYLVDYKNTRTKIELAKKWGTYHIFIHPVNGTDYKLEKSFKEKITPSNVNDLNTKWEKYYIKQPTEIEYNAAIQIKIYEINFTPETITKDTSYNSENLESFQQNKKMTLKGRVEYYQKKNNNSPPFETFEIENKQRYENTYYISKTKSTDLNSEEIELLKSKKQPFVSSNFMLQNSASELNGEIKKIIRRNKNIFN